MPRTLMRWLQMPTGLATSLTEVLLLGAAIYWCEGSKSKPWRRNWSVRFINSDVVLIRTYLRFLRLAGAAEEQITYRVSIHESADVEGAKRWWEAQIGLPEGAIDRETLKRHNPTTVRHNVNEDYRGCLVIRVNRSRDLYWRVEGIIGGLAKVVGPTGEGRR